MMLQAKQFQVKVVAGNPDSPESVERELKKWLADRPNDTIVQLLPFASESWPAVLVVYQPSTRPDKG